MFLWHFVICRLLVFHFSLSAWSFPRMQTWVKDVRNQQPCVLFLLLNISNRRIKQWNGTDMGSVSGPPNVDHQVTENVLQQGVVLDQILNGNSDLQDQTVPTAGHGHIWRSQHRCGDKQTWSEPEWMTQHFLSDLWPLPVSCSSAVVSHCQSEVGTLSIRSNWTSGWTRRLEPGLCSDQAGPGSDLLNYKSVQSSGLNSPSQTSTGSSCRRNTTHHLTDLTEGKKFFKLNSNFHAELVCLRLTFCSALKIWTWIN